jgi:hypothetical protein
MKQGQVKSFTKANFLKGLRGFESIQGTRTAELLTESPRAEHTPVQMRRCSRRDPFDNGWLASSFRRMVGAGVVEAVFGMREHGRRWA